jgi:N-acetylglucosaminyldiphosphoundecaprenol N-acetyl-beta-D-mannosaminyltransferase
VPSITLKRATFLGVPLDPLTMDETIEHCRALVLSGRFAQHVVLNAGKCVLMEDEPDVRDIVKGCDLVNADGQGVVWAAKLLGLRVPERVAGIDLMGRLLALCEAQKWPVYFLGASDEVLSSFSAEVRRRHPGLPIAGFRNGYFGPEEEPGIVGAIRDSQARVLLVGISSPMKERLLARNRERLGALLAMGVGGSFDVWAGKTTRAPMFMQRMGLEWFHRFAQEPRRMWRRYLIGNLRFMWIVLRARLASR